MERQDKIKIIEAIQAGMPIDLALKHAGRPIIAIQNEDGKTYIDDKLVSETEIKRIEKIPGVHFILIVNKSGMTLDGNGHVI